LKVGAEFEVRLRGMGTSGYRWDFVIEEGSGLVDVRRVARAKPPEGQFPTGQSVDQLFVVDGLSPGRARVRFTLQRPWQVGKVPPIEERVLEVTILS